MFGLTQYGDLNLKPVVFVTTIGGRVCGDSLAHDDPTDQLCSPPNWTARAAYPMCWPATENACGQIVEFNSANSYVNTDGAWAIS